eukprot:g39532.t1
MYRQTDVVCRLVIRTLALSSLSRVGSQVDYEGVTKKKSKNQKNSVLLHRQKASKNSQKRPKKWPHRPTFPFCRWRLKFFKPPHTLAKTLTKTLTKTLHHTLHAWYRHEKEEARKEGSEAAVDELKAEVARGLGVAAFSAPVTFVSGDFGASDDVVADMVAYRGTASSTSAPAAALREFETATSSRRPCFGGNQVMDILGAESGRLYSENSIIIELAKWGFAAITRIRQDTKAISILTPSSTPAHVNSMQFKSYSSSLLGRPSKILWKIMAGETVRFVPKCKRRRGQEQLRLAYQSGDDEDSGLQSHYADTAQEWKVTVIPSLRSEWTRLINLIWILDRTGKQKRQTKRLAALQDREEKLRRENKSLSDLDEQERTEIRLFLTKFEFHTRAKNNKRFYDEDLKLCARDLSYILMASNHGKGLCDSHAGKIAQAVAFHNEYIWQSSRDLADQEESLQFCSSFSSGSNQQLHCFEAMPTPGKLRVSQFRDSKRQIFTFKPERSNVLPKPNWLPSAAALACILMPAALPIIWLDEQSALAIPAMPAAVPAANHRGRGNVRRTGCT